MLANSRICYRSILLLYIYSLFFQYYLYYSTYPPTINLPYYTLSLISLSNLLPKFFINIFSTTLFYLSLFVFYLPQYYLSICLLSTQLSLSLPSLPQPIQYTQYYIALNIALPFLSLFLLYVQILQYPTLLVYLDLLLIPYLLLYAIYLLYPTYATCSTSATQPRALLYTMLSLLFLSTLLTISYSIKYLIQYTLVVQVYILC